jgi:hypothetical protein
MKKFIKKVKRLAKAYDVKIAEIVSREYNGKKSIEIRVRQKEEVTSSAND